MNKFEKNIIIRWRIEIQTGLHIGGGKEGVKIGGTDNPVIRTYVKYKNTENDPGTTIEIPYIPGSSVKGKMRSLLEAFYANQSDKIQLIKKLFGVGASEKDVNIGPTRLIVRDSYPTTEWLKKLVTEDIYERGTEIKGENKINRENGRADPRFIERVIPGIDFDLETIVTIYEGDDENALLNILKEGIELLQDSYLGGQGTRGYGKVKISQQNREDRDIVWYERKALAGMS